MQGKYICPKCGNKIKYWKVYIFDKEQIINPITGQLNKIIKTEAHELDSMTGLRCTECTWFVNDVNEDIGETFDEWYEDHQHEIKV